MRLELGRRADYAIRAAVDLARHRDDPGRRKARAIAEEMGIPVSYVPQILAELVRAGIASSVAGPDGGYALARDPQDVSLRDLLYAADGDVVSTSCVLRGGPCRWEDMCAVHVPWARAQQALLAQLAATSLADVVDVDRLLDAGTYVIPDDVLPPVTPPRVVPVGS
jgi:Rrf2 family transcriptional regulator, iron-sulfur cluster assembly transcription factor